MPSDKHKTSLFIYRNYRCFWPAKYKILLFLFETSVFMTKEQQKKLKLISIDS